MILKPKTRTTGQSREEQARCEIGHTDVSHGVAVALAAIFIALVTAGFVALIASPSTRGAIAGLFASDGTLKERIVASEAIINRDFPAAVALREPVQVALAELGAGDEQVALGNDGWLFYKPDISALTGRGMVTQGDLKPLDPPEPAAVSAVKQFHDALDERGVGLILLPVPVKPGVHPDKLRSKDFKDKGGAVIRARGFSFWRDALEKHGCAIFDAAPALSKIREEHGAAYLKGDTHWTPEAMDAVAAALASEPQYVLEPLDTASPPVESAPHEVTNAGDTAMMLALPDTHELRTPETVEVRPIEFAKDVAADVVLLGDSFSNIYSLEGMGWGADAGLAERLAFHLGRPVNAFIRNDGGAWGSRERFLQALARGQTSLKGVKAVIWQFSERELAHGDWKEMSLPEEPTQSVREAEAAGTIGCAATVAAVSSGPRLDAPYSEFIIKWHVAGIKAAEGVDMPDQAVVLLQGMSARKILPTAAVRPGAKVSLKLRPWSEVESDYGSLNTGLLDDEMLEIELPLYWAEEADAARQ